jgi:hypothetical protein
VVQAARLRRALGQPLPAPLAAIRAPAADRLLNWALRELA